MSDVLCELCGAIGASADDDGIARCVPCAERERQMWASRAALHGAIYEDNPSEPTDAILAVAAGLLYVGDQLDRVVARLDMDAGRPTS